MEDVRKFLIAAVLALCCAIWFCGCDSRVSQEQADDWSRRLDQMEQALPQAVEAAEKAEAIAERYGSEKAAQLARDAREEVDALRGAIEEMRKTKPEAGQPWWIAIGGAVASAASWYFGQRRGRKKAGQWQN